MTNAPFKVRFCEHFHCPESEYERRALSKCLYLHARLIGPVLQLLNPSVFELDRKLIRYLGDVTELRDAMREVLNFQDNNVAHPTMMRNWLRIRASGRNAKALAEKLFNAPGK